MSQTNDFFQARPDVKPMIYAFKLVGVPDHNGYLKVGYTDKQTPEERVHQIMHTSAVSYKIVLKENAMKNDGQTFTDHDVHDILKRNGFRQYAQGEDRNEWFKCTEKDVLAAISELRTGIRHTAVRNQSFAMRPEQARAVKQTMEYFVSAKKEEPNRAPKFLWNAKMRFGKTFAAYQLAKKSGFKRILILTFKPAVQSAWEEDLETHVDFDGWQYISNKDAKDQNTTIDRLYIKAKKNQPIVVFGSFQDLKQRMNLSIPNTGTWSSLTNTISAPGVKTRRSFSITPMKKPTMTSIRKNTRRLKRTMLITKPSCRLQRTITCSFPAQLFAL